MFCINSSPSLSILFIFLDEHLHKPNATTVGDNLAVLISWNSINCDFYRIVLRSHIPESDGLFDRSTIDETVSSSLSVLFIYLYTYVVIHFSYDSVDRRG